MPVVFFPEKDKEALYQVLGGGVTVYHIKNVNVDDIEDLWHHIFVFKQGKKVANNGNGIANKNSLRKQTVPPVDSRSSSLVHDSNTGQLNPSSGGSDVTKKARVVWTIELNNRFIEAYNQLGHQGATPCRILELMNDPRLTRFHVASHLQKYRSHLREMQEELNPRRSKFRYKVSNPNFSSQSHVTSPIMSPPQEPFIYGTNNPPVYHDFASSANQEAPFTNFLSEMEDEDMFALAQNQQIPSLSPTSSHLSLDKEIVCSPDQEIAQLPNKDKFNDILSMFEDCMCAETHTSSYVGFKISNAGSMIWDTSSHQVACEVTNIALPSALQLPQKQEPQDAIAEWNSSPKGTSPFAGIESSVTFDSCFDIYEMVDFDIDSTPTFSS